MKQIIDVRIVREIPAEDIVDAKLTPEKLTELAMETTNSLRDYFVFNMDAESRDFQRLSVEFEEDDE